MTETIRKSDPAVAYASTYTEVTADKMADTPAADHAFSLASFVKRRSGARSSNSGTTSALRRFGGAGHREAKHYRPIGIFHEEKRKV